MNSHHVMSRTAAAVVLAAAGALVAASSAAARPYDDDAPRAARQVSSLPLERIGSQFVRGDNLTGAGSPAPSFVPEAG